MQKRFATTAQAARANPKDRCHDCPQARATAQNKKTKTKINIKRGKKKLC